MMGMFYNSNISSDININMWDVKNVTTITNMFSKATIEAGCD